MENKIIIFVYFKIGCTVLATSTVSHYTITRVSTQYLKVNLGSFWGLFKKNFMTSKIFKTHIKVTIVT